MSKCYGMLQTRSGTDNKVNLTKRIQEMQAPYSDNRLISVIEALDERRAALIANGDRGAALVLSVAILELRIKLNQIDDLEFRALCDAMYQQEALTEFPPDPKPAPKRRRNRAVLKLIK